MYLCRSRSDVCLSLGCLSVTALPLEAWRTSMVLSGYAAFVLLHLFSYMQHVCVFEVRCCLCKAFALVCNYRKKADLQPGFSCDKEQEAAASF